MPEEIQEQLTKYLTDAHSIEEQALAQLRTAPDIAGDPELSADYREHLKETEEHERRVREALGVRGAKPSRVKDTVMRTLFPTRRSSSRRTSCSPGWRSGPATRRSSRPRRRSATRSAR